MRFAVPLLGLLLVGALVASLWVGVQDAEEAIGGPDVPEDVGVTRPADLVPADELEWQNPRDAADRIDAAPPPTTGADPASQDRFRCLVRYADDGTAYAGRECLAHWATGSWSGSTDGSGRFVIHTVPPPTGTWTLRLMEPLDIALGDRLVEAQHELPLATDGSLELWVERAARFVEVEVVQPPSSAVPCDVHFLTVGDAPRTLARLPDDPPARFGLHPDQGALGIRIWATTPSGAWSMVVAHEREDLPPLVRLDLRPGADLAVRVWSATGEVVSDRRVFPRPRSAVAALTTPDPIRTDGEGRVEFRGLAPVTTDVAVEIASGGFQIQRTLDLVPGERTSIDVTLAPETPVAVAGVVLDEGGTPLPGQVVVVEPLGLPAWWAADVTTDERGRFRFHAPACDRVRVLGNQGALGDQLEPDVLEVAHGTDDVVLRRLATAVRRTFLVRALDARTLDAIGDVVATFDRGAGSERWSNTYGARQDFDVAILQDTRMRVAARGYGSVAIDLLEALDGLAEGGALIVHLEPGLHHTMHVRDANTGALLPDAALVAPDGSEVTADANGRVTFANAAWTTYTVTHPGYVDQEWDPDDSVLFDWGDVQLEAAD